MIYTAITSDYDRPRTDVLCFNGCTRFNLPVLNAKIYKVLVHHYLDDEWTIWIDGNMKLKMSEEELISIAGPHVTVFENPYRDTVGEEMDEVLRLGLDKKESVEALRVDKNAKLAACYLIIRRNTNEVKRANERWWSMICSGSVRDQLSFPEAYKGLITYLPKTNPFDNKYFTRHGHDKPRLSYRLDT